MRTGLLAALLLALSACGGSETTGSPSGGGSCQGNCQGLVCGSGVDSCGNTCTAGCLYGGCVTPYPCSNPKVCSPTLSPAAYTRCIADCEGEWKAAHGSCCSIYLQAHPTNTCQ